MFSVVSVILFTGSIELGPLVRVGGGQLIWVNPPPPPYGIGTEISIASKCKLEAVLCNMKVTVAHLADKKRGVTCSAFSLVPW